MNSFFVSSIYISKISETIFTKLFSEGACLDIFIVSIPANSFITFALSTIKLILSLSIIMVLSLNLGSILCSDLIFLMEETIFFTESKLFNVSMSNGIAYSFLESLEDKYVAYQY